MSLPPLSPDFFRNFSFGEHNPAGLWLQKPPGEIAWKVLLTLPIVIFGLVGNFLIMLVIYKFKQTRNCTNLFICNMAVADFFATLLLTWAALAADLYQGYQLVTCLLASVLTLSTISADRLIGIDRPFSKRLTNKRAMIAIAIIWIVSIAIAMPLIFGRWLMKRQWSDFLETWCYEIPELQKYWLWLLSLLVYFPLTVMVVAYVIIIARLSRYEERLGDHGNPIRVNYRRQVVKMLFVYVLAFVICTAPLQVLVFYRYIRLLNPPPFKNNADHGQIANWYAKAFFVCHVLASLNSAINPIIYGVLNETFRKAICLLFPRLTRFLMPGEAGNRNRNNRTQQTPGLRQPGATEPIQAIYDQNMPRMSFAIQSHQNRQNSSNMKF